MKTKLTILLVDDERDSREVMSRLLAQFADVAVVGQAASADEAFAEINLKRPDVVFLDIQMPKADGFSLLKRFLEIPFEVVFVTSYDQYAINAIKFSALDYLLKPVEVGDLRGAIEKAQRKTSQKRDRHSQIVNLLHNFDGTPDQRSVAVHAGEHVKFLSGQDIAYILADGRYCHIAMNDGSRHLTARYLKDFEAFFGEGGAFIRIGKSHLVNVRHIESYSKGDPCFIKLKTGDVFEASRRKKQEVLARLAKLIS
jgi:two-component system LytT family response regulator